MEYTIKFTEQELKDLIRTLTLAKNYVICDTIAIKKLLNKLYGVKDEK